MNENQIIRLASRENGFVVNNQTHKDELEAAAKLIERGVLRISDKFGMGEGVRLRAVK